MQFVVSHLQQERQNATLSGNGVAMLFSYVRSVWHVAYQSKQVEVDVLCGPSFSHGCEGLILLKVECPVLIIRVNGQLVSLPSLDHLYSKFHWSQEWVHGHRVDVCRLKIGRAYWSSGEDELLALLNWMGEHQDLVKSLLQ